MPISQDLVFTLGTVFFVFALLGTIFSKDKPPVLTSLCFALILTIFGFTYVTLGLWMSAILTWINALLWGFLVLQKKFNLKFGRRRQDLVR